MMALPDLVCPVEVLLDLFSTDLELEACKTNLKTQACSAKWPRLVDTVAESHQERQKKKNRCRKGRMLHYRENPQNILFHFIAESLEW